MGAALRRLLVESWKQRGALALLLWPVSLLYGVLVAMRHLLYRTGALKVGRIAVPVVVVGNVVAGGAGKTPVVIALVQHLKERGFKPGVVSRGYGRHGGHCREVRAHSIASEVGDEPILILRATGVPVVVASKRIDAAHALLSAHPEVDVVVSDDGLQHHDLTHRMRELSHLILIEFLPRLPRVGHDTVHGNLGKPHSWHRDQVGFP